MSKWGQSPPYTVGHDPQDIERKSISGVRGRGAKIGPFVKGFLGGWGEVGGGKNALRRLKTVQASLKRRRPHV